MHESGVFMVILKGIFLPLIGTTLGSACVFFMKSGINDKLQKSLLGFAAGVMTAASVWSLIIPAVESCEHMGMLSFVPAFIGFWIGIMFLYALDKLLPEIYFPKDTKQKKSLMIPAVVLHNLPEGMAVGVVLASLIEGSSDVTPAAAITLAAGIAIQNFPEGSIISMPLAASGKSKLRAFTYGFLSGVVEPIGAIATILLASVMTPILPYMLSFAAGAMVFVAVNELIPKIKENDTTSIGAVMFALGFSIMMALDIALG